MAQKTATRVATLFWDRWVAIHNGLYALSRFGGWELGGSPASKASILAVLFPPRDSKRPMEITCSGLGYGMADGCAMSGLLGGCSRSFCSYLVDSGFIRRVEASHSKRPFSRNYSGPRSQRSPLRKLVVAQGVARRAVPICWVCWVDIHGLFVSSRLCWCELSGSLTHTRPFSRCYPGPVLKRPTKETGGA